MMKLARRMMTEDGKDGSSCQRVVHRRPIVVAILQREVLVDDFGEGEAEQEGMQGAVEHEDRHELG